MVLLLLLQDSGWDNKTALGYFRSDWRGTQWNTTTTTTATTQGPTSSSSSDGHSGGVGGGGLLPKKPVWIGFKGGNGQSNHNDLDAGTFVFEMEGHRFVCKRIPAPTAQFYSESNML